MLAGTSGRNAIATHGGFNFSEFNIQDHKPGNDPRANYNEQERTHAMLAGRNPLNPPSSTLERTPASGLNKDYGWRENTLQVPTPAQANPVERSLALQSGFRGGMDASRFSRAMRHGLGQNDPALQHLVDEKQIAPVPPTNWRQNPDSYLHSDVGVPSALTHNLMENATQNEFSGTKVVVRGNHAHQILAQERTPSMLNESSAGSGTHHTAAAPGMPVVSGFRADRPLMLSDLPTPPAPNIIPQMGPGPLEQTSNRGVYLYA